MTEKFNSRGSGLSILLFMVIGYYPVLNLVNGITQMIGWSTSVDTAVIVGISVVSLLVFVLNNIWFVVKALRIVLFAVLILILSLFLHDHMFYFPETTNNIIYCSIYFIVGFAGDFSENTRTIFNRSSKIVILMCLITFLIEVNQTSVFDHLMVQSYLVLTPTVILFLHFFEDGKKIDNLIFAIIGFILIILYGTRGPLLALLVSVLVVVYFFSNRKIRIIFTVLVLALIALYQPILSLLNSTLENIGVGSSRIIQMLMDGDIAFENGRSVIQLQSFTYISQHLFHGLGLYGCRAEFGQYPHNVFLEIFMQFGIIPGVVLILSFIVFYIKRIRLMDKNTKHFVIVITFMILAKLFVSGSYLDEFLLFFILGILCSKRLPMCEQTDYSMG